MYHYNLTILISGFDKSIEDAVSANLKTLFDRKYSTKLVAVSDTSSVDFSEYRLIIISVDKNPGIIVDKAIAAAREDAGIIIATSQEEARNLLGMGYADRLTDIWPVTDDATEFMFRFSRACQKIVSENEKWLSDNYLNSVIENTDNLVWFKDRRGAHLKVNNAFCDAVHKTKEQIAGRGHYYIWDISPEEYMDGEFVCMESEYEVMGKKERCIYEENIIIDNEPRKLRTSKTPLFDIDGTVMGTVGMAQDVTNDLRYISELEKKIDYISAREKDNMFAQILLAVSKMHLSVHFMDIDNNSLYEFYAAEHIHNLLNGMDNAYEQFCNVMNIVVTDEYIDRVMNFIDFGTLKERMQRHDSISMEFIGKNLGWCRAIFVKVEESDDGYPKTIIFITQIIDSEKKKEENLLNEFNTDELTGLYNHRAYRKDMEKLSAEVIDGRLAFVDIDVDGVETVNSLYGRNEADKLLKEFSRIVLDTFGVFGRIYRITGTRFVGILNVTESRLNKASEDFDTKIEEWNRFGSSEKMVVVFGTVARAQAPASTVEDMYKLAELRKGAAKTAYYLAHESGRHGEEAALDTVGRTYVKILKANLTTNEYEIIITLENELHESYGFKQSTSSWLRGFAEAGCIHPDDVDTFIQRTDLGYLKSYFSNGHKVFSHIYRRLDGEDYRSAMLEMIPAREYSDDEQIVFLYVQNIE